MKTIFTNIIFYFFMFCFSVSAFSREEFKGYIITITDDTIWGKMSIPYSLLAEPVLPRMSKRLVFIDPSGLKTVFKPASIKGYVVTVNSVRYTFHSFNIAASDSSSATTNMYTRYVFLQLIEKGTVRLYKHHYYAHSAPMMTPTGQMGYGGGRYPAFSLYLYKAGSPAYTITSIVHMGFKKQLKEYFSDYPFLVAKIDSGDYKYKDTQLIVNTYNIWKMTH